MTRWARFRAGAGSVVRVLGCDEASSRERWAIAIALGTIACLYAFGLDFILGRGPFWEFPVGDAQMNLIGYRYFVTDDWHLPLLRTTMVGDAPKGINIAVLDSVPIVALVGKLLVPIVGASFVPYGVWMLAVYVLQAYFAIRLVYALGARSRVAGVAAAVFALTLDAFLGRFFHLALNAQFLILWALCLYFEVEIALHWRFACRWIAVIVVALLVHPYLFAMVVAICAAALVHGVRRDVRDVGRRAAIAVAIVVSLVLVGVVTGHAARSMRKGSAACCFGHASHNLGSLIVPTHGHSSIWPDSPGGLIDQTSMQWDGSMFLGFPALLLIAIVLVRAPRELGAALRRHVALSVTLVAMLAFAASNRAFVFDTRLWSFEVPDAFARLTGTFRASGRFAWPFGLTVVMGTLAFALRMLRPSRAVPLVLVLAGVGIVEATNTMRVVRENTRVGAPRALDPAAIGPALAVHERVEQWPSYQCLYAAAFAERESRELQFLAAELGRPINGVRAGRQTTSCPDERARWRPFETRPGVIAFHLRALVPVERPASCRPLGIWVICTHAWARPELAALRAASERDDPAPTYQIGERIDSGFEKRSARYLDGEWSHPIAHDQMIVGERLARLRFAIETPGEYMLAVELVGWFGGGTVEVFVNGAALGEVFVEDERAVELALPHIGGITEIAFRARAVPPRGQVGVRSVTLVPRGSPP